MCLVDPVTFPIQSKNANEEKKAEQNKIHTPSWLTLISAVVGVLAVLLFWRPLTIRVYNSYIRQYYLPSNIIRHFVETPVHDVEMGIPMYYECDDFRFPDLTEAIDIQFEGRLRVQESVVFRYHLLLHNGTKKEFEDGLYPNNTFFLKMLLSDQNAIYVDGARSYGELYYTLRSVQSNDLPFFVTQLLADQCLGGELDHYSEDRFVKLFYEDSNYTNFLHMDFVDDPLIRALTLDSHANVTLKFVLLGSDQFSWDLQDAFDAYMTPYLERLSSLFNFNIETYDITPSSEPLEQEYIDEEFPKNLTDLPGLAKYYKDTKDDGANVIHLLFYPFGLAPIEIANKTVDNNGIYSTTENTILKLPHWGSLYFSHSPKENASHFPAEKLQDCMWSFTETILNQLGFPNENMSPMMRLMMAERIAVVNYLTYYSDLLFLLEKWLTQTKDFIGGSTVDTVTRTLRLRSKVLEQLKQGDARWSIPICQQLVAQMAAELQSVGAIDKSGRAFVELAEQVAEQNL